MSSDHENTGIAAGRPVTLSPLPPGVWLIIGGSVIASLGPLFGFLIGSMIGSTDDDLSPIYLFLFAGLVVGGIGIGIMLLGVRRVMRERRRSDEALVAASTHHPHPAA